MARSNERSTTEVFVGTVDAVPVVMERMEQKRERARMVLWKLINETAGIPGEQVEENWEPPQTVIVKMNTEDLESLCLAAQNLENDYSRRRTQRTVVRDDASRRDHRTVVLEEVEKNPTEVAFSDVYRLIVDEFNHRE